MGLLICVVALAPADAASTAARYYSHPAVEDRYGVIAPWYKGQNGQFDWRVRIAAETMKRYPWAAPPRAVTPGPEYLFNGKWTISRDGKIKVVAEEDWNNGDLVQRAANAINGWERYYLYSGDPAAFTHISVIADYLVDHCQTDAVHGWPRMVISVPTHGVRYGACRIGSGEDIRANGKIQIDIAAEAGLALVRAYEMTGNQRWYETAKHWADLMVQNRRRNVDEPPWGRYAANTGGNGMTGEMNGSVAFLLTFFDELIRTGYTGTNGELLEAREAGKRYLRDVLLPAWTVNITWGRNYWDGPGPVHQSNVSEYVVQYLMSHPEYFSNWKNDVRNILSLFLNHTSADPASAAEVYSGAWASPESENCCNDSLAYVPMRLAGAYARYAALSGSEWAREMARRQQILATYDMLETGWGEDSISGTPRVYGAWFKIAHPMALRNVLGTMAWLSGIMGPNRENHLMRSSSVVRSVTYGKGVVAYEVFDGPPNSIDVVRLSFLPASISGDGKDLKSFQVERLAGGDSLVTIRRDGVRKIEIRGEDPHAFAASSGAGMSWTFTGNQVRVIGGTGKSGGKADVFLDGVKQLAGIDFYTPSATIRQVLFYRNGLADGQHTLKLAAASDRNPLSAGSDLWVDGVQYSSATGDSGFGEGGGPTEAQRFLFGYTGRKDYIDSEGHAWRPGTEFIARTGRAVDPVARTWWVMARQEPRLISGTRDPELYLYGIHGPELTVNVTVGPGVYYARLKFAETEFREAGRRGITILINGEKKAADLDLAANKAVDLVFNNLQPRNGIVEVRLQGVRADAILQALEVGPGKTTP